ncbi:uncharacterized protein N7500_006534 [Penicillium coprophilum]|uniref:uncharacterized protein n=1 Tax=Penicillium coprophilum TaxID=36646 RepID=UPI002394CFB7|nr:uncharacterized protein N7500_006534 [Penicillium coprophilum]KAJ5164704.1 hypothetical protein N7500_006534 [Penicillium coprophilum]
MVGARFYNLEIANRIMAFASLKSSLFLALLYIRRGPLDISYFAVLKRAYSRLVETKIRYRINYIDKLDFLKSYPLARIEAYKPETIKNSFKAAAQYLSPNPNPPSEQRKRLGPKNTLELYVITKVLKACQITIQSTALLEKEIQADKGLSVQEASQLITKPIEAAEAPPPLLQEVLR